MLFTRGRICWISTILHPVWRRVSEKGSTLWNNYKCSHFVERTVYLRTEKNEHGHKIWLKLNGFDNLLQCFFNFKVLSIVMANSRNERFSSMKNFWFKVSRSTIVFSPFIQHCFWLDDLSFLIIPPHEQQQQNIESK